MLAARRSPLAARLKAFTRGAAYLSVCLSAYLFVALAVTSL